MFDRPLDNPAASFALGFLFVFVQFVYGVVSDTWWNSLRLVSVVALTTGLTALSGAAFFIGARLSSTPTLKPPILISIGGASVFVLLAVAWFLTVLLGTTSSLPVSLSSPVSWAWAAVLAIPLSVGAGYAVGWRIIRHTPQHEERTL